MIPRSLIVYAALALAVGLPCPAAAEEVQGKAHPYTVFMLVRTQPAWLSMTVEDRFAFLGERIAPILAAHPDVAVRFFDTEHLSAQTSDVIQFQTADLPQYFSMVERLRETAFWGTYFEVQDILTGVENAYADYYGQKPLTDDQ